MQNLFRHGLIYTIAGAFSGGLSLILLPIYARNLRPAEYGVLELLALVTVLVTLTVALEVHQGVARFYPEARSGDDQISIASNALWFSCVAYGVFAVIALAGGGVFSALLIGSDGFVGAWRLAVVGMVLLGVYNLARNQLRFQLQPLQYAISSFLGGGVTILLALWLIRFGVTGALIAQAAGSTIGAAYALFMARAVYQPRVDRARLLEMLRFSGPLVLSSLGVWLNLYVDRLVINALLGTSELGVYAAAYRVGSVVSVVTSGLQGALTPLVYAHHTAPETPRTLARLFSRFALVALVVLLVLSLSSRELIALVTAPEYAAAARLITPMTASVLVLGVYVFAPGLPLARKSGTLAMVNLGMAGLNLLLNFVLIPPLGLMGSALATLFSAIIGVGTLFVLGARHYPIPYLWARILSVSLLVMALAWWGASLGLLGRLVVGAVGVFVVWWVLGRVNSNAMPLKGAG
jgi:O-antigen/teichoic acid export membrane protein